MTSRLGLLAAALSAVSLTACATVGGYGGERPYAFYDGFYGPYDDGYWGPDGVFVYGIGGRFHRDEGGHFRRGQSPGYRGMPAQNPHFEGGGRLGGGERGYGRRR